MQLSEKQAFLVKSWSKHCKEQSALHDYSWSYFKQLNMWTSLTSILLSSISGVSLLGITPSSSDCGKTILYYVLGGLGLASGTLLAINRFCKYPELQEQHDIYCDSFELLGNDISLHAVIHDTTESIFKTPIEFIKHIKNRMDILIDKAPAVPLLVRSKLRHMDLDKYKVRNRNSSSSDDKKNINYLEGGEHIDIFIPDKPSVQNEIATTSSHVGSRENSRLKSRIRLESRLESLIESQDASFKTRSRTDYDSESTERSPIRERYNSAKLPRVGNRRASSTHVDVRSSKSEHLYRHRRDSDRGYGGREYNINRERHTSEHMMPPLRLRSNDLPEDAKYIDLPLPPFVAQKNKNAACHDSSEDHETKKR
jgi:hypothetical protein